MPRNHRITSISQPPRVQDGRPLADAIGGAINIADKGRWEPLTNGDAASPELIFADGDTIMVFIPEP